MSNWIEAITSRLVCPHCGAANAPGRTYIERVGGRCVCIVCSHAGKVEDFLPDPKEAA